MKYYAVIDTNVLVSALLNDDSIPGFIISLVGINKIVPVFCDSIMTEYDDVLGRKKFNFETESVTLLLYGMKKMGVYCYPIDTKKVFQDEDDKKFYDLYKTFFNERETFLITGNKKHFPSEKNIVNPREMLEIIATEWKRLDFYFESFIMSIKSIKS